VNYCQVEKENTVQDSDLKRRMFLFFGKAKYVPSDEDSTPCFSHQNPSFSF